MGSSTTISRRGFTLVELLVVITIIGILIGLLLPAVLSAIEAGRSTQCRNNLHQIGVAVQHHESVHGAFPAGGWGWGWVGDADLGNSLAQPGGWIYNILDFMDAKPQHDLGLGASSSVKMTAHAQRNQMPMGNFLCPTRRAVSLYPFTMSSPANYNQTAMAAKTDYAANGGDIQSNPASMGIWPSSCGGSGDCGPAAGSPPNAATVASLQMQVQGYNPTGMIAAMMMITAGDVTDGLSNTYLAGEKYLQPELYANGQDLGDNETIYTGDSFNITRYTGIPASTANPASPGTTSAPLPPLQDRRGVNNYLTFGSAHLNAFNVCMGDGSVRPISYTINPLVHQYLGNRADGQSVQPPP